MYAYMSFTFTLLHLNCELYMGGLLMLGAILEVGSVNKLKGCSLSGLVSYCWNNTTCHHFASGLG
jgi:hypothetical protein